MRGEREARYTEVVQLHLKKKQFQREFYSSIQQREMSFPSVVWYTRAIRYAQTGYRNTLLSGEAGSKREGLSGTQVNALLGQARSSRDSARNYAILHVLLQTGIRLSECSRPRSSRTLLHYITRLCVRHHPLVGGIPHPHHHPDRSLRVHQTYHP